MRTAALAALFLIVSARVALGAELRTTQCGKHGVPEIGFEVRSSTIPEADRQWVIKTLEDMVAGGSRFKAGETLQLGSDDQSGVCCGPRPERFVCRSPTCAACRSRSRTSWTTR